MKKYAALFAINALIFGALSGNAWMTIAASDQASPITWAMAVAPLVILAGLALWLLPRALAAMKSGQTQRAEAKQERAEAHVAQAVVDDSAASRLRRFSQPANAPAPPDECEVSDEAEADDANQKPEPEFDSDYAPEPEADQPIADEPEWPEVAAEQEPAPEAETETAPEASAGQWDWLMNDDAVRQLRPATETRFPWVGATIAEVASAVINALPENGADNFIAEAEAWLTLSAELLPTTEIAGDDAQSFVGWVNDLVVYAHMTHKDVTLDALLDAALANLCERADDDDALAAALPASVYSGESDQGFNQGWAIAG